MCWGTLVESNRNGLINLKKKRSCICRMSGAHRAGCSGIRKVQEFRETGATRRKSEQQKAG